MKTLGRYLFILVILGLAPHVQAQNQYYIDLYADINLTGAKHRVPIYQNERDLQTIKISATENFNDQVSSVDYNLPADWEVVLWAHSQFQGPNHVLRGQGRINDLSEYALHDRVSSLQWRSTRSDNMGTLGTNNCQLRLFEDAQNKGRVLRVDCNKDIRDLSFAETDDGLGGFDNKTSAIEYNLPDGVVVRLYKHRDFKDPVLFELRGNGKINSLDELKNDQISSIRWSK